MADQILIIKLKAMQQCATAVGIGIDVSGTKLDLAVRFSDHSYFDDSFENNAKGIKLLLSSLKRQEAVKTAPLVLESTGDCHIQPALMIKQSDYLVKVINPVLTKKYQKSSIRNSKSDKIDARRLADIAVIETDLPDFTGNISDISNKKLASLMSHLEKMKQRMNASLKQFEKTNKILKIKIDLKPIKRSIKDMDDQMMIITDMLKKELPEKAKEIVRNTKGISEKQMAIFLALIGNRIFEKRSKLIAFTGLDIALRQSGGWQGRQKISKRGDGYIRKILYQIAWSLWINNDDYRNYYNRLKDENKKHYNTVMMALSRKFLRFMYAYYFQSAKTI